MVKRNLPVEPAMIRREKTELELLKGVKVRVISSKGGSSPLMCFIFPHYGKESVLYEFRIALY